MKDSFFSPFSITVNNYTAFYILRIGSKLLNEELLFLEVFAILLKSKFSTKRNK